MINSFQSNKGFSLVEMMITLAISAIIIGAAFGSYTIIARNYDWQTDMKYMSQSARTIVNMIQKDIRNAGFRFESQAAISDPITIYDASDCCDRIEIIYDETETPLKRIKIEYRLQQYSSDNSRFRLYKKKTNMTNNTVEFDSPIADYVEALQFNGFRNSQMDNSGAPTFGMGNMRWIKPSSVSAICEDQVTNVNGGMGALTASGSASYAFDGNDLTTYSCKRTNPQSSASVTGLSYGPSGWIVVNFSSPVRITKIKTGTIPQIDGGTGFHGRATNNQNYQSYTEPYGKYRPVWIEVLLMYGRSGQQCVNTCEDSQVIGNSCDNSHWQGGQQCTLQTSSRYVGANVWDPIENNIIDLRNETRGGIDKQVITQLDVYIPGSQVCRYDFGTFDNSVPPSQICMDPGYDDPNGYMELSELEFYGEVYGEPMEPQEVEISIALRSPNEHGNVDRPYSSTIGNFVVSKTDKYLRDNYTTSTTMRNVLYQSQ